MSHFKGVFTGFWTPENRLNIQEGRGVKIQYLSISIPCVIWANPRWISKTVRFDPILWFWPKNSDFGLKTVIFVQNHPLILIWLSQKWQKWPRSLGVLAGILTVLPEMSVFCQNYTKFSGFLGFFGRQPNRSRMCVYAYTASPST